MRLRTRVTLVSAVLMAVVLSATGVFVYLRLQTKLRRTLDETLRSRADAELLVVEGSRSLPLEASPDDAFAQLIAADGSVVESSSSPSRGRLRSRPAVWGHRRSPNGRR